MTSPVEMRGNKAKLDQDPEIPNRRSSSVAEIIGVTILLLALLAAGVGVAGPAITATIPVPPC